MKFVIIKNVITKVVYLTVNTVARRIGIEVLMAVSTQIAVFWVIATCSLVEVYHCFRGICCLHHQGPNDRGYTALKPSNIATFK
jgi:hypothetical protein